MSPESRRHAGILLIMLPSAIYGSVSILSLQVSNPRCMATSFRQDLWRAGHTHAAVLLVVSLVLQPYVDEANLPNAIKSVPRLTTPAAAILLPFAFFLSVLSLGAKEPDW